MPTKLMLDNWLLQDIAEVMSEGLSTDITHKIDINYASEEYYWEETSRAAVQIECLMNFLIDIVTRDNLVLDEQYAYAWNRYIPLSQLNQKGIISTEKFNTKNPLFREVRKSILNDICVIERMKETQKKSEETWNKERSTIEPYFSQVIWGTAGNLSRSNLILAPYSPHPIRKMALEQTSFKPSRPDAIKGTLEWVKNERISVFSEVRDGTDFRAAQIILPPLAVEIIEACSSVSDLFKVALQIREEYKGFRKYLEQYQTVLDDEDPKAIIKYRKVFDEIHNIIKPNASEGFGGLSISIGTGLLNLNIPLPNIATKFGIRATLQKIVFQKKGEATLRKLLAMFDVNNPEHQQSIQNYFKMHN